MTLTGRPRGFGTDSPTGSGRGSGVPTALLVSEPRFRRFYKVILKLFVNDFEIVYDMHCICI